MRHIRVLFVGAMLGTGMLMPAAALGASDVLPDLGMMKLNQFRLDTSQPGRRLLRFNTRIANRGPGTFELEGSRASLSQETMTTVVQHVYDSDGGHRTIVTTAKLVLGGDGHNHWHVHNLETYELTRVSDGGNVGTSLKAGFCFWDNFEYKLSLPGAPQSPVYTGCGTRDDLSVTMGLSVGWADKYPWRLPDQYIDISDLPNGRYRLTATADPKNWFLEANDSNNFTWTELDISSSGVSVVRNGPRF